MRRSLAFTTICVMIAMAGPLQAFQEQLQRGQCTSLLNQGAELLRQGKLRESQQVLENAEHGCANMPEVYATLALSYDLQSQHLKAQQAYRKAIALNPNIAAFHDNLGISFAASGNLPASVAEFEKALRIDPHDRAAKINLARHYLQQRKYHRAIDYFRTAGIPQSRDIVSLMDLTKTYFETHNIPAARETAARVSTLAGSDAKIHFSLGLLLAQNGQYKMAAEEFCAVPASERDFATYMNLGMTYSKLRQFQDAHNGYESALQLDPSSPEPYFHIGLDAATLGKNAQAVNWLSQAHALAPGREDVAYAYTEALIQSGNYDRASSVLSQALQLHALSPQLIEAQGDLYLQQDQSGQAKQAYLECLDINPHLLSARLSLAQAYLGLRQPQEARQQLEKVLHIQPENPVANAQLGRMAFDAGHQEEAQRMIETALKLDPDNRIANETLAEIKIRESDYSEAYTILQMLVKLNPEAPRFHYLLGRVLIKLGRPAEAQSEFQLSRSLQNAPAAARPMVSKESR
jgi:tetratricopeptide (TPR) repeat protein